MRAAQCATARSGGAASALRASWLTAHRRSPGSANSSLAQGHRRRACSPSHRSHGDFKQLWHWLVEQRAGLLTLAGTGDAGHLRLRDAAPEVGEGRGCNRRAERPDPGARAGERKRTKRHRRPTTRQDRMRVCRRKRMHMTLSLHPPVRTRTPPARLPGRQLGTLSGVVVEGAEGCARVVHAESPFISSASRPALNTSLPRSSLVLPRLPLAQYRSTPSAPLPSLKQDDTSPSPDNICVRAPRRPAAGAPPLSSSALRCRHGWRRQTIARSLPAGEYPKDRMEH